jgi:hypothetical protein
MALVLAPERSAQALAQISVGLTDASADQLDDAALERLRIAIPAARGLPLLRAIALRQDSRVVLDYLGSTRLAVTIALC